MSSPLTVILVGPTAVGKSAAALALALLLDAEVVAADSLQVYCSLTIGSAKPSPDERRRVPHHMLDLVDPEEPFTAMDYAGRARRVIQEIWGRGRVPLIVGGTGLYIRAVVRGLFHGPGREGRVRCALYREAHESGPQSLHRRLSQVDPEAAARIHPHDAFRIVRALEVFAASGYPLSRWQADGRGGEALPGQILWYGLERQRSDLYSRIEARVEEMIARGIVEEVRGLLDQGYSPLLKPLQALGYRHVSCFLRRELSWEETVRLWKRDSRRYAKRQMTWFRREEGVEWLMLHPESRPEAVARGIAQRITDRGLSLSEACAGTRRVS